MSGRRTRASSQNAAPGFVFGSFGTGPLAADPSGVTRIHTSPARSMRSAVPTAQASNARGRPLSPGSVDEYMIGIQPVQAADQSIRPPHSTTAQGADGTVDEGINGGTVTPRASSGRDLSAEGVTCTATTAQGANRRVEFQTTTAERSSVEEEALRARISLDSLQLSALTTSDSRRRGTSVDRSGPSTSTNPILRGATPTERASTRTTPYIPVRDHHDPPPREIDVTGIYNMAKGHIMCKGPEDRDRSTNHMAAFK
jgi:hypothetical protein